MGIYEHKGMAGQSRPPAGTDHRQGVRLPQPLGLPRQKAGELSFVRLLPPLVPELATYHIVFTTPYVLIGATKKDWIDFLRRNIVGMKSSSEAEALAPSFMKCGLRRTTGTSSSSSPTFIIKRTPFSYRASPTSKPRSRMHDRFFRGVPRHGKAQETVRRSSFPGGRQG